MKLLATLLLLTASALAQYPAAIAIEETTYPGSMTPSGTRSAYPVSFSVPLKQGDFPTTGTMGLTGATAGQFRCLGYWRDGSCKWVQVDTELNYVSGSDNTSLAFTSTGAGNFGGSNLATDNGSTITVNTGVAQFVVRKANFDVFSKVTVNGKVLVDDSVIASDGLVLQGPDLTAGMPSTPSTPSLNSMAGGSYSTSRTYYVIVGCVGASGESAHSAKGGPITVTASHLLQVTAPTSCGPNATGYTVYVSNGTGDSTFHLQTDSNGQGVNAMGSDWTEPTSCVFTGDCLSNTGVLNFTRGAVDYAGSSDGCGTCTTEYKSSLDPSSTAAIEENGPVKTVVKATGSHLDGSGHTYMRFTVRMTFWKGKAQPKVQVILRNADDAQGDNLPHFASDAKGLKSYEIRISPVLGSGAKTYKFSTTGTPASGTLDGSTDALKYQAYSNNLSRPESDNAVICTIPARTCVMPDIFRYPAAGSKSFLQEGFFNKANGSTLTTGTRSQYDQGWADLSDSTGAGIEAGVWYMSAYWPKAIQFKNTGSNTYVIRVGLLPDQTQFNANTAQPYYMAWPQWRIFDTFWNFHDAGLSDPANDFLYFQHFLAGRAPIANYNNAGVFPAIFPLLSQTTEDSYIRSVGAWCCLADKAPQAPRYVDWGGAGEGNQHEFNWAYMRNYLTRGHTGRLLYAVMHYRWLMEEQGMPHSDFTGGWRSKSWTTLTGMGFPDYPNQNADYAVGNSPLAQRNWHDDDQHPQFFGVGDGYYLTGDETLHDSINQGWADYTLNDQIKAVSGLGNYSNERSVGGKFLHQARAYTFWDSQGRTADRDKALLVADKVMKNQLMMNLQNAGYGSDSKGISPTRGIVWTYGGTSDAWDSAWPASPTPYAGTVQKTNGVITLSLTTSFARSGGTVLNGFYGVGDYIDISGTTNYNGRHRVAGCGNCTNSDGSDYFKVFTFNEPGADLAQETSFSLQKPGKCPIENSGSCSNLHTEDPWKASLSGGLLELAAVTGSNATWALHDQALDEAYGVSSYALNEVFDGSTGFGEYMVYLDWYQTDKYYYQVRASQNSWWLHFTTIGVYNGNFPQSLFESYLLSHNQQGPSDEYDSYMMDSNVAMALTDPAQSMADIPSTVTNCTALGCDVTYTPPDSATAVRIKGNGANKQIVEWLYFDNVTDPKVDGSGCTAIGKFSPGNRSGCYGVNPATNWPWFSSPDAAPVPAITPGLPQTCHNCTFIGFNTGTPANNKFAVKAVLNGYIPPPAPILNVAPLSLTFEATQGGGDPVAQSTQVTNTGTGTLSFTATSDQAWLSVLPISGDAPATLQVSASITGLNAGIYTGHITVTALGAQNSPATVTVTLNLASPPSGSRTTFKGTKASGVIFR